MQQKVRRRNVLLSCCFPAVFFAGLLNAESAILECTADGLSAGAATDTRAREMKLPGIIFVNFRTWNITRWQIDSAQLFLHVARGDMPKQVEIAVIPNPWAEVEPPKIDAAKLKWVAHPAEAEPQNWLAVQVDTKLVEEIANSKGHGLAVRVKENVTIHARESTTFVPYLIVAGGRK
jgi:hypothetical protein